VCWPANGSPQASDRGRHRFGWLSYSRANGGWRSAHPAGPGAPPVSGRCISPGAERVDPVTGHGQVAVVLINRGDLRRVALPPCCRSGFPGAGPELALSVGRTLRASSGSFVEDGRSTTHHSGSGIAGSHDHSPAADFTSGFGFWRKARTDRRFTAGWPPPPGRQDFTPFAKPRSPPANPTLGRRGTAAG